MMLACPQAFQMLAKAGCLPSAAYLDISGHTELTDSVLSLVLSRCGRRLAHLSARGTQLGSHCLLLLGTPGRLDLVALDLSGALSCSQKGGHGGHVPPLLAGACTGHSSAAAPAPAGHGSTAAARDAEAGSEALDGQLPLSSAMRALVLGPGASSSSGGLRHRHPSQLQHQGAQGPAVGGPGELHGRAQGGLVLGAGGPAGAGSSGASGPTTQPSFMRLLRSALGRLTRLTGTRYLQ